VKEMKHKAFDGKEAATLHGVAFVYKKL